MDVLARGREAEREQDTFKSRNIRPDELEILGDRYLILELDVDNFSPVPGVVDKKIELAGQDPTTLGWMAGRIVAVGGEDRVSSRFAGMGGEGPLMAEETRRMAPRLENNEWTEMHYKVGETIICERMTGREVHLMGRKYRLVNQQHVYARVKPR